MLENWGKLGILRQIGRGAHGDVYLAHDPDLDRDVALKLYRPDGPEAGPAAGSDHTLAPEEILHEGRLMARVRHPNVIVIHGAEEREGRVGIWMDHVRGMTLEQMVQQQGNLGAAEAALIAIDLCRALAAVHATGILHRDIKAQNVMREVGGRIVLMDFGVSSAVQGEGDRFATVVSGTPLYMAPETLLQGASSVASEVYSMGVLLFHLVSARYPVEAKTLAELVEAHRGGIRTRVRDLRPDLPTALTELVEKAVAVDPRERFAGMADMESALMRVLGASQQTVPETVRPRKRLRFLLPTMALVVVAAVVVAGWFVTHSWLRRPAVVHEFAQKQLTFSSDDNPVQEAAISPNGNLLAYADDEGIHIRRLDTGEISHLSLPRRITVEHVAWFPDGLRLFVGGTVTGDTTGVGAWECSLLGGEPRNILSSLSLAYLSPDGRKVAYMQVPDELTTWVRDLDEQTTRKLVVSELDGPGYVPIGWNHSSDRIVLRTFESVSDDSLIQSITSCDLKGHAWRVIVPQSRGSGFIGDAAICWLADGTFLYSEREATPNSKDCNLWVLHADPRSGRPSGKPTRLTNWAGFAIASLSATADAEKVAVLRSLSQVEICVGDLDERGGKISNVRRLTRNLSDDRVSTWESESRSVLFVSERSGVMDVYRQRLDQENGSPITGGPGVRRNPVVSSDGEAIVYRESSRSSGSDSGDSCWLMTIPVSGGTAKKLSRISAQCGIIGARTSRGPFVLAERTDSLIVFQEINPAAKAAREIGRTVCPVSGGFPYSLSQDGSRILILDGPWNEPRLRVLSVPDGVMTEYCRPRDCYLGTVAWMADGRNILAHGLTQAAEATLFRIDSAGRTEILYQDPTMAVGRLVLSPDGRHVAFGVVKGDRNVWLLEGF